MGSGPTILLVEDNPVDVALIERAFSWVAFGYRLAVVGDGAEAKKYVVGEGVYADRVEHPFPRLILLDLSLPVLDGFEFLKWMRDEIGLRHVPIIVLSGCSFS